MKNLVTIKKLGKAVKEEFLILFIPFIIVMGLIYFFVRDLDNGIWVLIFYFMIFSFVGMDQILKKYKKLKIEEEKRVGSIHWESSEFALPLIDIKKDYPETLKRDRIRISERFAFFDDDFEGWIYHSYTIFLYKKQIEEASYYYYLVENLDPEEYEYNHYSYLVNGLISLFEDGYNHSAVDIRIGFKAEGRINRIFDQLL